MLLKFCVVETSGEQLLVSKPAALMMIVNSRNSLAWKRPVVETGNTQVQFMRCMGSGMYEGTAMLEVVCSYWLWRCPSSLKSIPPLFCQVLEEVTALSRLHTFSPMLNVFIFSRQNARRSYEGPANPNNPAKLFFSSLCQKWKRRWRDKLIYLFPLFMLTLSVISSDQWAKQSASA